MILYSTNVKYASGQAASGQPVTILVRGTNNPASLYADGGGVTPLDNPVRADQAGNIAFYLAPGSYDLSANGVKVPFDAGETSQSAGQDFIQGAPADSWTINHNLGHRPIIDIFTVGGVKMIAEILHVSVNQTVIYFSSPTSGFARVS